MADPNPLDDLFRSETDESVVNALVASLESRLASPTNKDHNSSLSTPSVISNHVSGTATNPACTSSANTAQNKIMHLSNDSTNVNSSNSKSVIKDNQILGINSIHSNSPVKHAHSPVNSLRTSSPNTTNGVNKPSSPAIQMISQPQNHGNHAVVTNVVQHMKSVTPPPQTIHLNVPNQISKPVINVNSSNPILVHNDSNRSSPAPHVNSHVIQSGLVQVTQPVVKNSQPLVLNSNSQPNSQKPSVHIVQSANVTSMVNQQMTNPSVITVRGGIPMSTARPQTVTSQVVNTSSPRPQGNIRIQSNRMPNTPIRIASSQPNQINIAPRPGGPTGTITLPPGIVPGQGAVLMKNEHGQLVIVQPGPGSMPPQVGQPPHHPAVSTVTITSSSPAQKVQYVRHPPSSAVPQRLPTGGQILTIQGSGTPSQAQTTVVRHNSPAPPRPHASTGVRVSMPHSAQTVVRSSTPAGAGSSVGQPSGVLAGQSPAMGHAVQQQQQMLENVKKCKNFLSTLIKLAASQPEATVSSVRDLIQGLIDGKLEPELFTEKLQKELKSSPQPYLVPFLKKSLPLLRQSLLSNKMSIDGVRPPPLEVLQQMPPGVPQVVHSTVPNQGLSKSTINQLQPKSGMAPLSAAGMPGGKKPALSKQVNMRGNMPSTVKAFQARVAGMTPSASPSPSHSHKDKKKFETLKDDDDINDVATMGGVNLSEESRNILATNADFIGTQIRSCKDETFLFHGPLLSRVTAAAQRHGISEIPPDVINLISHATQERLRHIVEKLSTVAEQRSEIYKINDKFEASTDAKSQLKFLEELDVLERKRHDEQEKEMLRRAAKSRSKHEDPEHLKLKQRAKDLQQAEMEELRQREANLTALAAIGPRKKRKLDAPDSSVSGNTPGSGMSNGPASSSSRTSLRPRIKRVNLRDLLFLMEQDRTLNKSTTLYRTFLK